MVSAADCKRKWKNLRDSFVRKRAQYNSKAKSGAEATTEPTWLWYKPMMFLQPYLSRNRLVSSSNQ